MEILDCGVAVIKGDTHHAEWVKEKGLLVHDQWFANKVCQHIQTGDTVVDVGANIGTITRAMLDCGAMVWAFEPNKEAVKCLTYNCPEAIIEPTALSDRKHRASLCECKNAGARAIQDGDEFDCTPLDDFNIFPTLIKIDAEGYEPKILEGARETIRVCSPVLILEVNASALKAQGSSPKELINIVEDLGYTWRIIQHDCEVDSPQYDIECIPIPKDVLKNKIDTIE